MEAAETLSKVADTVTEKNIVFEITVRPQNGFEKWLQEKKLKALKRKFVLRPLVLGTLLRISRLLLTIDPEMLKGENYLDISYHVVDAHAMTLTEVIAIAIQNTKAEPSPSLIKFLNNNLSPAEMMKLLQFVITQMDLASFIGSIISIRGLNVLESDVKKKSANEVSPMTQGS